MEPANMNGSCGIMAILDRKSRNPSVLMSIPSRRTVPVAGSTIRNRATNMEDLPLPVRPQIPTFSPELTVNVKFFNTKGKPGR